jgi:hypothetical protein
MRVHSMLLSCQGRRNWESERLLSKLNPKSFHSIAGELEPTQVAAFQTYPRNLDQVAPGCIAGLIFPYSRETAGIHSSPVGPSSRLLGTHAFST